MFQQYLKLLNVVLLFIPFHAATLEYTCAGSRSMAVLPNAVVIGPVAAIPNLAAVAPRFANTVLGA
jgi:hypothetical protein